MDSIIGLGRALTDSDVFADFSDFESKYADNKIGRHIYLTKESAERLLSLEKLNFRPGGSAANTICECANMGIKSVFVGSIGNDKRGMQFARRIKNSGAFSELNIKSEYPTGFTLLVHSKDRKCGLYYYGASDFIDISSIDKKKFDVLYAESYIFSAEAGSEIADSYKKRKTNINSINLSGIASSAPEIVAEIIKPIVTGGYCDILIGNENEFKKLFEDENIMNCAVMSGSYIKKTAITRGDKGSIVVSNDSIDFFPVYKNIKFDSGILGDGDSYAAGFLTGIMHGYNTGKSALLGSYCSFRKLSNELRNHNI
ncbi:hypothetical protein HYZ41_03660 [archaeon]|nr:hypothetical protein [archaeon]